jgi:hypothetical protein
MRAGVTAPPRAVEESVPPSAPPEETRDLRAAVRQALGSATRPRERAERALQMLLENVGISSGFLFLWRQDELTLAAPLQGDEPPEGLQSEATRLAAGSRLSQRSSGQWMSTRGESFRLLALRSVVNAESLVVAVLAFPLRDDVFSPPSGLLLRAVSDGLLAAGDAQPSFAPDPVPR